MNPFFTIVRPTYKRPDRLKRAIESVLKQTFSDFEIVVVNNADEDVILPVQNDRITLLQEKKKGANFARNRGIENSKGKFICFLDDDDVYFENHLQTMYDLIQANDSKVAMYRTFTKQEVAPGIFKNQPVITKPENDTDLDHVMTILLVMHCVCCHRDILQKIKFEPSIPVAQDYHMWIRIVVEYPLVEIPEITTLYHFSSDSTSSPSLEKYLQYIKVYKSLFSLEKVKLKLRKEIEHRRLFNYYNLILQCNLKELKFGLFLKIMAGSIRYKPSYLLRLEPYKLFLKYFIIKFKNSKLRVAI